MAMSRRVKKRMKDSGRIRNNPNAGFTLIEVMLSIGILAIISAPLLRYFSESVRYSSMVAKQQQATFLAQEVTEGLLAQDTLVVPKLGGDGNPDSTQPYQIPFLEGKGGDEAYEYKKDQPLLQDGKGTAVYTRETDGYNVEVKITSDTKPDDLKSITDYGVNPLVDLIYIDMMENTQAVFEIMEAHNNYYDTHPGGTEVTEEAIREKLSRDMNVTLTKGVGDIYHVKVQYVYTSKDSGAVDEDGFPFKAENTVMDKDVEVKDNLLNLYLVYKWCNGGDTIVLTSDEETEGLNLGLYVIYQQRDKNDSGPKPGNVSVNTTNFKENLSGFTNYGGGCAISSAGVLTPSASAIVENLEGMTMVYTIETRVYQAGDEGSGEPLTEITAKKGE